MNKTTLKKLLISIILVVMLSNFMISNIVLAEGTAGEQVENVVVAGVNVLEDFLGGVMGSVVGLLTKPFRALALALANALDGLTADIAYSQGAIDENGVIRPDTFFTNESITPFDIFFNRVALVDVNFFNIPQEESIIRNVRVAIAGWYYVMRNIAASILLCVLIYVGIRMALSTVASDKASYKKMLVDWVCSLALIFLIQYIIIFTFSVNEALISALKSVAGEDTTDLVNAMEAIKRTAKNWITLDSIPATIVYCMLVGQTLGLLMSYFNRMLKIAFLIIISPLITLTYSIDKMGDGKAQALGTWLKEFVYTVLIQTFHCIIYLVFMGMAISILNSGIGESYNLAGSWLAVICVKFTKDAEKLLGKIFKFGDSTSDASIAAGMMLSAAAFQNASKIGKGTVKAVNGAKSLKGNIGNAVRTAKVDGKALAAVWAAKKSGESLTYAQAKDKANEEVTAAEARKAEKKNEKKYGVSTKDKEYQKQVSQTAKELMKETGMTKNLAYATARAQVAADKRAKAKESKFKTKHPKISSVRGAIQPYKEMMKEVRSTEAYKLIASGAQAYASTGIALFTGATMYGMNGDAFKSMAFGGTAFKGSQEVFKNSSTTLVDSANTIMDSLGVKDKAGAAAELQRTQSMAPLFEKGKEEDLDRHLDSLLKCVDDALKELDPDKASKQSNKIKTDIKNTVAREVKSNPNIGETELMNKIAATIGKNPEIEASSFDLVKNHGDYGDALNSVADTRRRKELYDVMQNASDLNLNPQTFGKMVESRYSAGSAGFKTNDEIVTRTSEERYKITDSDIEERTKESREELKQQLMEEFNESTKNYDPDDVTAIMETQKQQALLENVQALNDRELDETVARCKGEYEKLAAQLKKDMEDEARRSIQKQIEDLNAKFQKDIDKFKGYNECSARKDENYGKRIDLVTGGAKNARMIEAESLISTMGAIK
ncbi:MAG: hypothetical protein IJW20_01245 [Clostridia bacterium]|nr:hypothetical protein [Clostridia bacterium]